MRISLIIFVYLLSLTYTVFASDNRGVLKWQGEFGHIIGNGMDWDYALIFELKKKKEDYRALSDIENKINESDTLVAIGSYHGIIIASIKSDKQFQELFSVYAEASSMTRLCDVNTFKWVYSKEWDGVTSDVDLRSLCR